MSHQVPFPRRQKMKSNSPKGEEWLMVTSLWQWEQRMHPGRVGLSKGICLVVKWEQELARCLGYETNAMNLASEPHAAGERERAQWWTRKPEPALWCVTGPASIQGHMGALPRELWKECGSRKKKSTQRCLVPHSKNWRVGCTASSVPNTGRWDEARPGQSPIQLHMADLCIQGLLRTFLFRCSVMVRKKRNISLCNHIPKFRTLGRIVYVNFGVSLDAIWPLRMEKKRHFKPTMHNEA